MRRPERADPVRRGRGWVDRRGRTSPVARGDGRGDHGGVRNADDKPGSAWRRAIHRWTNAQPRPRSELVSLLRSLDGRDVQLRSYADRFGRVDQWSGTLDATQLHRREVDIALPSGETVTVALSWIGYVVDDGGRQHGPFRTPVSLM